MNIRDKIFYKETIKMANIPNTFCFLVDEKCKNEILEKFIDFSSKTCLNFFEELGYKP